MFTVTSGNLALVFQDACASIWGVCGRHREGCRGVGCLRSARENGAAVRQVMPLRCPTTTLSLPERGRSSGHWLR
jgi:hypothetical protein